MNTCGRQLSRRAGTLRAIPRRTTCGRPRVRCSGQGTGRRQSQRRWFSEQTGAAAQESAEEAKKKAIRKWRMRVAAAIGLPLAIPVAFVLNLKYDPEFKEHFDDKYPDLIDSIRKYIDLNDPEPIVDVDGREAFSFEGQTLVAKITTDAGKFYRVSIPADSSPSQLLEAIRQRGAAETENILDASFEDSADTSSEEDEDADDGKTQQEHAGSAEEGEILEDTPENREKMSTWPSARPARQLRQIAPEKKAEWELANLRAKQAALEQELKTGMREIDTINAELAQVERQKKEVKKRYPKKKFMGIF